MNFFQSQDDQPRAEENWRKSEFENSPIKEMLKFIKEKNGFKSYQAKGFQIYYGEKGAVAGDNNINVEELIYLIDGKVEVTINSKIEVKSSPAEINIPAKTYHKIKALTDVKFLFFKK